MKIPLYPSIVATWYDALRDIIDNGTKVSPRGKLTKEILQRTFAVDMRRPVLVVPERKLSYKFMAAEAFWILTGDSRVSTIAPFNKNISQFSDDGEKFFGAYGPKIIDQLEYVTDKLVVDQDTRQAGLTIWRENPPDTKDVPCTVAIFFNIRDGLLNAHVFMRSSDIWLGVPYDVFNFSMLSHYICGLLNLRSVKVKPGALYLTAASSHLYEIHFDQANDIVRDSKFYPQAKTPKRLYKDPENLMIWLDKLRYSEPGDKLRWWEH